MTCLYHGVGADRISGIVKYWPTWMPFSDFKKHAVSTRALVDGVVNTPYNWVKDRMVGPPNCFVDCLLVNHRFRFRPPERQHNVLWLTYSGL